MTVYFPLNKYEVGGSAFALSCGCLMLASQFHLDTSNYNDLYRGVSPLAGDPGLCERLGLDPDGIEARILLKTRADACMAAERLRADGWANVSVGSVELPDPDDRPVEIVHLPERPCCDNCEYYQMYADDEDGDVYSRCVLAGRTKTAGNGADTWCRLYRRAKRPEKLT